MLDNLLGQEKDVHLHHNNRNYNSINYGNNPCKKIELRYKTWYEHEPRDELWISKPTYFFDNSVSNSETKIRCMNGDRMPATERELESLRNSKSHFSLFELGKKIRGLTL